MPEVIPYLLTPNDYGIYPIGEYESEDFEMSQIFPGGASIYALVNPINNKVFYIGVTVCDLRSRLSGHIKGISHNAAKKKTIKMILKSGMKPIIVELCRCFILDRYKEERRWINGARKKYKITNHRF